MPTKMNLDRHLDRLYEGANAIEMNIGISKDEMITALKKTLEKNRMTSDVHIRLIVSRGIKSTPYQHPKVTVGKPTIVIIPVTCRPKTSQEQQKPKSDRKEAKDRPVKNTQILPKRPQSHPILHPSIRY